MNAQEKERYLLDKKTTHLSILYNKVKHEHKILDYYCFCVFFKSVRSKFWKELYNTFVSNNNWFKVSVWYNENPNDPESIHELFVSSLGNYTKISRSKTYNSIEITSPEHISYTQRIKGDWCIQNSSSAQDLYSTAL